MFIDNCEINYTKFGNIDNTGKFNRSVSNEFWGIKSEYEITIISQKLREILNKNGFNYNKIIKDWAEKGYVEKIQAVSIRQG